MSVERWLGQRSCFTKAAAGRHPGEWVRQMANVFTVFFCGTDFHRHKTDELVAEMARMAVGKEYENFLILDGPGSDTGKKMPGKFNPFTKNKEEKKRFGKKEMGHTHINTKLWGGIAGTGWEDNIIHAMATIAELKKLPSTINMLGWSRGAVSCTKLAYVLNRVFPQVKVNIFAVDPVAGIGNKADRTNSNIFRNVENYCALLAMDENAKSFKPQNLKRVKFHSRRTNAVFLPMPGNHRGSVVLHSNVNKGVGASPLVSWHLAYEFLVAHGTRLKGRLVNNLDESRMLELYADMMLKRKLYDSQKDSGVAAWIIGLGFKQRRFVSHHLAQYVLMPQFFVNLHHFHLFKRRHPQLFRWVFHAPAGRTPSKHSTKTKIKSYAPRVDKSALALKSSTKAHARKAIQQGGKQFRIWLDQLGFSIQALPERGQHDPRFARPLKVPHPLQLRANLVKLGLARR